MRGSAAIGVSERRFNERGLLPSIAVPEFSEPTVRRLVKAVGQTEPGLVIVPPSLGAMWPRLAMNAVGTFITVIGASLLFLVLAPTVVGYRPVAVISGSMTPALQASDVVMLQEPVGELPVGAVVDFTSGQERRIHRIVEVDELGYRTKGDANPSDDSGIVTPDDVNGVGVMVVPLVGAPQLWIDQGRWLHLAALAVVIVAASWVTPRRWMTKHGSLDAITSPVG